MSVPSADKRTSRMPRTTTPNGPGPTALSPVASHSRHGVNSIHLIKPLPDCSVPAASVLHGPVIVFDVFSRSRYRFYQLGDLPGNPILALAMELPLDCPVWDTAQTQLWLLGGPQYRLSC